MAAQMVNKFGISVYLHERPGIGRDDPVKILIPAHPLRKRIIRPIPVKSNLFLRPDPTRDCIDNFIAGVNRAEQNVIIAKKQHKPDHDPVEKVFFPQDIFRIDIHLPVNGRYRLDHIFQTGKAQNIYLGAGEYSPILIQDSRENDKIAYAVGTGN
ncbi:MAG: hypothetical protein Q8Q08_05255 [Candidatus Omnitrophota bacterium]|nr:hypothetical protein [Candidatus Omnitrophota bacterium]